MVTTKKALLKEYKALCQLYGLNRGWDMIHCNFSPFMFCKENRASLIAEYLTWQDFVKRANKVGFIYYCGIDTFLSEYKNAIESRVNLD